MPPYAQAMPPYHAYVVVPDVVQVSTRMAYNYIIKAMFHDDTGNKFYAQCDCDYVPGKESDKLLPKRFKHLFKINKCTKIAAP